ncbi:MAG: hypothetical protein K0S38_731 [Candidatus Paceibacter sp.]|nr:hypothetical protein [Candidatus Paceibacter sp.]
MDWDTIYKKGGFVKGTEHPRPRLRLGRPLLRAKGVPSRRGGVIEFPK